MINQYTFEGFPKIARLNREIIITEKLDGTNAQIVIQENGAMRAGSRNRWVSPEDDNYGFAAWVELHQENLQLLGPGRHFGEWWGNGIQRRYGQAQKNFSLFRAPDTLPLCCHVVPVLYRGAFSESAISDALLLLAEGGSVAAPGFKPAEGIVIYHVAARVSFKVTLEHDELRKGQVP